MRSFSGHCGVPFSFAAIGSDSLSEASLYRQRKLEQLGCLPPSGYTSPVENMPDWLQAVTLVNPLRYIMVIAKGIFLKALPAAIVFSNIWPMAAIAVVTLSIATLFFRRRLA